MQPVRLEALRSPRHRGRSASLSVSSSSSAQADVFKLLLIGDSGSGKSSLLTRFCDDAFRATFATTVGIDFKIRTVELADGRRVKLQVWDTAGQERFRAITKAYYRNTMCVLLVYDCTDKKAFERLPYWRELMNENLQESGRPRVIRMLVAAKCDSAQAVDAEVARTWAETNAMDAFVETSSKTGANVTDCFMNAAHRVAAATATAVQIEPLPAENVIQLGPAAAAAVPASAKSCCK